ncbi:MAG TPA: LysM peptidoglycan-binding domain-containing protein [Candidatus Acidoferrales bacterium]|nr:LysM peptidoglycan-binding domain-containing protein [Candidatus Acidoferrales bacterium]
MKFGISIKVVLAALALALVSVSGCNDTAKHAAKVRPPAATPQPAQAPPAVASTAGPPARAESQAPAEPQAPKQPQTPAALPLPKTSSNAQTPASQPQSSVDQLIKRVQSIYNSGQQAYDAGQLAEARKDFNAAVNLLMKSGLDETRDPRLQQLFNQITDTMQNYEIEAEQEDEAVAESGGDASDITTDDESQDQSQAAPESTAPIEEIASMESLPATDPRLAAMAEKELITVPHDLPLTINPLVLQYLSYFESPRGRDIVEMGLQRAGRYRAMIESTLKKEGLPQDLIYLAQAESAFKPKALSRMGARGIWQFMPYRGEEYGLDRNYFVDERDDPVAATQAAAEHLRDLYSMFGDWYLAMAAYNSGPVNVARAVQRTGYADFWELEKRNTLPAQTKNYVPIILALTLIAKDPALYGIQVEPDQPLKYDSVSLDHSISLQLVADATGSSLDDLQSLNPQLVRGITPATPGFSLRLPQGTSAELRQSISSIPPDKWTSWRLVKFQSGDSIGDIARRFHVTLPSLKSVNDDLDPAQPPADGTELVVPAAPPRLRLVHYRVRRSESLDSIAMKFSVSVSELKKWNHIRVERVPRGRTLRIYENVYASGPVATSVAAARPRASAISPAAVKTAAGSNPVEHRVRAGETLWSIARAYRTTVDAIKAANPFLASRGLEVGDLLTIAPH